MATGVTLTFRKVYEPPGSYGARYVDISRPGIDGHVFKYAGARGSPAALTAIAFFNQLADARAAASGYEAAIGQEVAITSTLDGWTKTFFLLDVQALPPEKIESTETNVHYRLRVRLDAVRTA